MAGTVDDGKGRVHLAWACEGPAEGLDEVRWRPSPELLGAKVSLFRVLPALFLSKDPYPFVEGSLVPGSAFHRHADLPPARITLHHVALDGHPFQVYSDEIRCQGVTPTNRETPGSSLRRRDGGPLHDRSQFDLRLSGGSVMPRREFWRPAPPLPHEAKGSGDRHVGIIDRCIHNSLDCHENAVRAIERRSTSSIRVRFGAVGHVANCSIRDSSHRGQ